MGKIADILVQRGETDEALRIHIEERLPVYETIKDLRGIAHIRFSCANLRLQRKDLKQRDVQTIYKELAESFAISVNLEHVDAIAAVGRIFGQILAMIGQSDEALKVLNQSAAAFDKLQQPQQAAAVRDLQKRIREEKK